ncbi:MAG: hypothetical protein COV55_03425 [Candidatus Komeilibacteria bacterium CG11_big_fil_rev_8_21_14_0_20_36_20]|uniref:N-acetyltransferase domain-containing protein n=1 Tax=Candidatus Komeilibacteria bacterium CG11_big_fil_rev_8_21_14_0_20_36_20 TaxID=1974477 RepID=A0A2H0NCD1_9BACT|nr:MAG: hypothetical protein COV55_03425 [Candidatus Komeilibacteria bacterium CG11_big_fil_rev_8_21_14_0_20_36_20]PIR81884.1 MAG: hypothetical protein COU21_00870 [Candidatus Komeilibacteria bacterium CG10_big_fil_rev_8_21_14_0_10_36_65]PJC55387.1 MAG: hypothetical protein CO027_02570 [Candidatus Komeilibacteria bacterium CG_4_9_14_0_2_um_filter_36_13]
MHPEIQFLEVDQDFDPSHHRGFIHLYKTAFSEAPYFETYTDEDVTNDVWNPHLKDGCIVVAVQNGTVVGFGCAMQADKWIHDKNFPEFLKHNADKLPASPEQICLMTEIAVSTEHRRKGIGTDLVKSRFEWARKKGYTHYIMRTAAKRSNSASLYQKLGGKIIEDLIQDVSAHAEEVQSQSTERIYIGGEI